MKTLRSLGSEEGLTTLIPGDSVPVSFDGKIPESLIYYKVTNEGYYIFMEPKKDDEAYCGWASEARHISFPGNHIYLSGLHSQFVRIDPSLEEYALVRSLLEA